jgi:hypothetical protein
MSKYLKELPLKIFIFMFIGIGYDALVTFTQQVFADKIDRSAILPVCAWMYLVYGSVPVFFTPIIQYVRRFFSYPICLLIFLALFWIVEYNIGIVFNALSIDGYSYRWWLSPIWSPSSGYISWHPAIIIEWLFYFFLIENIDVAISKFYPQMVSNFKHYWSASHKR